MRNFFINIERFVLRFKSTVEKACPLLTNSLNLLFMACPAILNTRSPATSVAITQNAFLARNHVELVTPTVISPPLENATITLYHKLSDLRYWISLSHALGQHSTTGTKNFLPHARPTPTGSAHTQSSVGSRALPANAVSRNQRVLIGSAQDSG